MRLTAVEGGRCPHSRARRRGSARKAAARLDENRMRVLVALAGITSALAFPCECSVRYRITVMIRADGFTWVSHRMAVIPSYRHVQPDLQYLEAL